MLNIFTILKCNEKYRYTLEPCGFSKSTKSYMVEKYYLGKWKIIRYNYQYYYLFQDSKSYYSKSYHDFHDISNFPEIEVVPIRVRYE